MSLKLHDYNKLYLTAGEAPDIDFESAIRAITALPGVVVVEMDDPPDEIGGILLADTPEDDGYGDGYSGFFKERMRPDVGTVIAVGMPVPGRVPITLMPSDRVLCAPYDGKWIDNLEIQGYKTTRRVKFFGIDKLWWESIIAEFDGVDKLIRTQGKQCMIMLNERPTKIGEIMLPDGSGQREPLATVVCVGPECKEVKVGDIVVYNSGKTKEIRYGKAFADMVGYPGRDADMAFIEESGIYAIVGTQNGQNAA